MAEQGDAGSLCPMVETTGVCQILYTLYKHGEMLTSKLQRKLPISPETFYKARNILEEHGLIEVVPTASGKIKPYRLTEKGRKIAEQIQFLSTLTRKTD
ncbi:MAG TPA: hypothetical protein ENI42_01130 [Thermoplasmatales archaeon]|nr:hypothetical protein [Thermoplasmatales archaeon]